MNRSALRGLGVLLLTLGVTLGCDAQRTAERGPEAPAVGPLVGHVTSQSAVLWLLDDTSLRAEVRELAGDTWAQGRVHADPGPQAVQRAEFRDLKPDRAYAYRVLGPSGAARWSGSLRTAPKDAARGPQRLALASCMHQRKDRVQERWGALRARQPDLLILLGDNVYANSTDPARIWAAHLAQRSIPAFAGAVRSIPTYAIWDDHDFGPNNAHGLTPGKAQSLASFRELWANPSAGTAKVPGVFFRARWGGVELFALDVRYHRSPETAPVGPGKTLLGGAQFDWLERALASSEAPIKLVASGSTIAIAPDDVWASYPAEHERLLRLLARTPGSVFLSGDLHRCAVERHAAPDGEGHGVWEVVSSGIAHGDERGFVILDCEFDPQPTLQVTIVRGDGSEEAKTLELE